MVRSFGGEYVFEVEGCVGGGFIKEKCANNKKEKLSRKIRAKEKQKTGKEFRGENCEKVLQFRVLFGTIIL